MRHDRTVLAGIVVFAVVVFGVAIRLRLPGAALGDEPHYLALTEAIVRYHTFDPSLVYLNRDYWPFHPSEIDAHLAVVDGRVVPFHNVGAPILFALPYLALGRAGAHLVMLAAAVATVVNMFKLQRQLGIGTAPAGIVTVLITLGSPVYVYASMLFVEPLGMVVLSFAARVALDRRFVPWRVALASAGVGWLPWIHGRYAIFPVTFTLIALWLLYRSDARRRFAASVLTLAPMVLLALGLEVFNWVMYRSLSPAPGSTDALGEGLLRLSPVNGLLYLAFDSRFGMLSNFPVLVLAAAGVLLTVHRRLSTVHLVLLGTAVPYAVVIATYPNWPGGFTPPGRLLSVVVPLLAYYVAAVVVRLPGLPVLIAAQLLTAYAFVMSVLSDAYPVERFHWLQGPSNTPLERLADLMGTSVDRIWPTVSADNTLDAASELKMFVWCLVTAVVVLGTAWAGRRRQDPAAAPAPEPAMSGTSS